MAFLRRPYRKSDPRSDPHYFEGSFGSTGCHSANLLNLNTCRIVDRDRLSFVQPGSRGPRIVYVTPGLTVEKDDLIVVRWSPSRPLTYENGLPLTLEIAGWLNPKAGTDDESMLFSHFRSFAHPARDATRVLARYDEWCSNRRVRDFATKDRETLDPVDQ